MPVASPYPLTGAACPGPACPHRGLLDPRPPIAGGNKQRTLERSWRPHGSAGAATGGGQASVTVWSLAEQSGAQGSPAQGRVLVAGLFHRIGVVVIRQPVHGGRERPPQAAHTLWRRSSLRQASPKASARHFRPYFRVLAVRLRTRLLPERGRNRWAGSKSPRELRPHSEGREAAL